MTNWIRAMASGGLTGLLRARKIADALDTAGGLGTAGLAQQLPMGMRLSEGVPMHRYGYVLPQVDAERIELAAGDQE